MTRQELHDLIQENWESELPDKVLEALRPFDGKPITTRMLSKLPVSSPDNPWRLRREYGMTHLVTLDYLRYSGNKGGISLLLCHTESSIPLNVREVEEKNPAYFSARKQRNHARMEAMNTRELLDGAVTAANRVAHALAELQDAIRDLDDRFTGYGKPLSQDRYDIERAIGLRDDKGTIRL